MATVKPIPFPSIVGISKEEKEKYSSTPVRCSPIKSKDRETAINGRIYSFEEGLARWDLTPEAIDIVIHTHLHNDHCENDYKCSNAEIFVHEKELESIHNPHPLDYRYLEDFIEDVEDNGQVRSLSRDTEIVPGISVMHTPVHTNGGMTVFIDTPKGRAAITGFCVIDENFNPPKRNPRHGDGCHTARNPCEHL